MLQQLNGPNRNNTAVLLQAMTPIQDQLVKLLRRLKSTRLRHVPRMSLPPAAAATSPRRTVPAIPASPPRAANVTFPTAPGDRTLPTAPFFEYPAGWFDNSQEIPDLSNIQDISLDYGISGEGIDWPRDDNFSIHEDADDSGSFHPTQNSSRLNENATFDTSTAAGPLPNVGSPRSPRSPRRSNVLNQTFQQRPGTSVPYQIRESSNWRNHDGSLSQVSRTVSGPDVSMVRDLETSLSPFQSSR
uniref:(northern house mosquito) hypothetical protein n=1 Tax=Culex pipiens TaxID=7175 RepID=A0A8D8CPP0_CULPI